MDFTTKERRNPSGEPESDARIKVDIVSDIGSQFHELHRGHRPLSYLSWVHLPFSIHTIRMVRTVVRYVILPRYIARCTLYAGYTDKHTCHMPSCSSLLNTRISNQSTQVNKHNATTCISIDAILILPAALAESWTAGSATAAPAPTIRACFHMLLLLLLVACRYLLLLQVLVCCCCCC